MALYFNTSLFVCKYLMQPDKYNIILFEWVSKKNVFITTTPSFYDEGTTSMNLSSTNVTHLSMIEVSPLIGLIDQTILTLYSGCIIIVAK